MNALHNLTIFYNNGQRDIYHYALGRLMTDLKMLESGSIYDIADYCAVSPATISRLTQKLGYRNYSEFRHSILDSLKKYKYLNEVLPSEANRSEQGLTEDYFKALERELTVFRDAVTDELLDRIIDAMYAAGKVAFYSYGSCFTEAQLQTHLSMCGKKTSVCQEFSQQLEDAKSLEKGDLALIIAPDNFDSTEAVMLLNTVRERGAATILLTDNPYSASRCLSDMSFAFDGLRSAIDMHFLYMFIDLLSIKFRSKYLKQ